jgi:hypothetical protein
MQVDVSGMPLLQTLEPFPGDYRTKNEIRRDIARNILEEERHDNAAAEAERLMASGEARAFLESHAEEWDPWDGQT